MSNLIIGTAGHVDHGKTQLIKALTGIDTDSHKEEKERGITIEPGFAYLTLPDGRRCGIIDVPGHEKFLRNMLAGAGSVDLALFVVACDEGIMPQSREHLEILTLLGIKKGIIVLTKTDLVEPDWLELVKIDVMEGVKGTFLENAPMVEVSAKTGFGIENLKLILFDMIRDTPDNDLSQPSRLPIDRVFTIDGFGTVVTGTLTEGKLSVGDELMLYPEGIPTKVRGLQVHSQSVQVAEKSQRVAINLAGVKTSDIKKGCVVAAPNSMTNSMLLDVKLEIVNRTDRLILNNSNLHFYHGTDDTLCRLVLLNKDALAEGESGYAQLHLSTPLATRPGDHFVVRFYSPMETVGGGIILDSNPQKRKRNDENAIAMFAHKESKDSKERLSWFIFDRSRFFPKPSVLKQQIFFNSSEFDFNFKSLLEEKEILQVKDFVIHRKYIEFLGKRCNNILADFRTKNPLLDGMRRDELRSKLLPEVNQLLADETLNLIEQSGFIKSLGAVVANADFEVVMTDAQKKLYDEIVDRYNQDGYTTLSLDELVAKYPQKDRENVKQTVACLITNGTLIALTSQMLIHKDYYLKAFNIFVEMVAEAPVTLAAFRDKLEISRKYAVAILEHFDKKNLTKIQGDARVLLKHN